MVAGEQNLSFDLFRGKMTVLAEDPGIAPETAIRVLLQASVVEPFPLQCRMVKKSAEPQVTVVVGVRPQPKC